MQSQRQEQRRPYSGRQQDSREGRNNNRRRRDKYDGPKKEAILKLQDYLNTVIIVTLSGGRTVEGKLTGFDQLMNLVLEDTVEKLRDTQDRTRLSGKTRTLGRVIIRSPLLMTISPKEGFEVISNPFKPEDAQEEVL